MAPRVPIDRQTKRGNRRTPNRPRPPRTDCPRPVTPPYLTHAQAAEVMRKKNNRVEFDRWRHVPTLELHYYPKGVAPEDQTDYVRYLP